jgi:hypothetical protein
MSAMRKEIIHTYDAYKRTGLTCEILARKLTEKNTLFRKKQREKMNQLENEKAGQINYLYG